MAEPVARTNTHERRSGWRLAAPVLALGLVLGGCASVSNLVGQKEKRPCPGATVVKDTSRLVMFRDGGGRDITDIAFEARLPRITVACDYKDNMVAVTTEVAIVAARGPANADRRAPIRYFVAVLDARDRVIAKREFETTLQFPVNIDRGATSEELVQRIPLAKGEPGTNYVIAVGFQLSREQLAFNRANQSLTLLGGRPPRPAESGFDRLIESGYDENRTRREIQRDQER